MVALLLERSWRHRAIVDIDAADAARTPFQLACYNLAAQYNAFDKKKKRPPQPQAKGHSCTIIESIQGCVIMNFDGPWLGLPVLLSSAGLSWYLDGKCAGYNHQAWMCTYWGAPGTLQPADPIRLHYTPAQATLVLGGDVSACGETM
jgi:hypothetical protein